MQTASYIPIRDESGLKSLSLNERDFIRSAQVRTDGRTPNELRSQRLQLTRWDNGAAATVQWGAGTRVTCSCTAELIPPFPDRPSEGIVHLTVDLSPSASTTYRQANPFSTGGSMGRSMPVDSEQKLQSNRILRCLERILLTGGALDTEALCITPAQWVWKLTLATTVLDAGGNLLDACTMACMAAIRHYRKPQLEMETAEGRSVVVAPKMIPADVKEPTPLPLHHTPLSISFALIPENLDGSASSKVTTLIDPDGREELVMAGVLTIAMNIHGEICLLDYGGGCELLPSELKNCQTLAESRVKQLCQLLEKSLTEADEQALTERLERLKQRQGDSLPPLPSKTENLDGIPYYQATDSTEIFMQIEEGIESDLAVVAQAETDAEEAYRKQALDYNLGHVATKVRENDEQPKAKSKQPSLLLSSMLKSLQGAPAVADRQSERMVEPQPMEIDDDNVPVVKSQKEDAPDAKPIKATTPITSGRLDSDEEDTTMELTTEFDAPTKRTEVASKVAPPPVDDDDDDVDDLAAAIKKKKSKKKKK